MDDTNEDPREAPAIREVDGVDVHIEGTGEVTLLMIHGWPDTLRLWDSTVAALRAHRRCVRFTLPGFDPDRGDRARSPDQVLELIGRIADAVSPERPLELMLHDWGCVYGYTWAARHPQRVARIVGIDIGDSGSRAHRASLRKRDVAMIAAYQGWLALACKLGGRVGDAMSRSMARAMRAPAPSSAIRASMDAPYVDAWAGRMREMTRTLARLDPSCPMLYVYGRRKPFMFHSPQWVEALAARPGCAVVPMRTGHWPMREAADEFERVVVRWLTGADG